MFFFFDLIFFLLIEIYFVVVLKVNEGVGIEFEFGNKMIDGCIIIVYGVLLYLFGIVFGFWL